MDRAVGQGVFPGGQFVVIEGGESVFEVVAGTLSKNNQGAVTPETYYDLASLTKPLVGLNLSLFLVSSGLLDLDRDLAYYLPDLKGHALETVTPAHLLSHTSGLPAWRAFYEELALLSECDRRSFLKQAIRHCDLEAIPGKVRCYSDIGFMLLQEVVERVAGDGAKNLYNMHILGKLGLKEPVYSADLDGTFRVASTEVCPWRMKALCGEVHDDNAWVWVERRFMRGCSVRPVGLESWCGLCTRLGWVLGALVIRRFIIEPFFRIFPLGWIIPLLSVQPVAAGLGLVAGGISVLLAPRFGWTLGGVWW